MMSPMTLQPNNGKSEGRDVPGTGNCFGDYPHDSTQAKTRYFSAGKSFMAAAEAKNSQTQQECWVQAQYSYQEISLFMSWFYDENSPKTSTNRPFNGIPEYTDCKFDL